MRKEVAVITDLVRRGEGQRSGRTAIMKWLFFLKSLRDLPLDYHFQLYTYGPFDSEALEDLSYAEALDAVKSQLIFYPGGYGYELSPGPKADQVIRSSGGFLKKHEQDLAWVIGEFGGRSASDLELLSTILYVGQMVRRREKKLTLDDIARKVHEIKPHFQVAQILDETKALQQKGLVAAED